MIYVLRCSLDMQINANHAEPVATGLEQQRCSASGGAPCRMRRVHRKLAAKAGSSSTERRRRRIDRSACDRGSMGREVAVEIRACQW